MMRVWLWLLVVVVSAQAFATPVQVVESSGLKALLIEERSVPIFTVRVAFTRSGAAWVTEDKQGLAMLASTLMNEGAGDVPSAEFQAELEKHAIKLYGSTDNDLFSITLDSLSEHREKALELMALAITKPRFDDEAVERMRDETLADLRRLQEKPAYIAARTWFAEAFAGHPYSWPTRGTMASLQSITDNDIKTFAKTHFARDTILIAVAGDISAQQLKPFLDRLAKELPEQSTIATRVPDITPQTHKEPRVIQKKMPQSVVMLGLAGIPRKDPDFYAAYVLNYILGGGELNSRLMDALRHKRGLVYSASSDLELMRATNIWTALFASANETAGEALNVARQTLKDIAEKGVTAAELEDTKAFLTGSFPLNMDTNSQLTSYLISMQLYDLGLDFLDKRNGYIRAVTLPHVQAVAKRLFADKTPLVVTVGLPK